MDAAPSPPLTQAERIEIFKLATRGLLHRYEEQFKAGMSDAELRLALAETLGIFGGSGGPNSPSVSFTGAGLRIWGGRHTVNHHAQKPLFGGDVPSQWHGKSMVLEHIRFKLHHIPPL
jgi:hypothetical protein